MNANQMITALTYCEVNGKLSPDCRRVLQGERFAVTAAAKSGDGPAIKAAMDEARRVAEMWGVRLA